MRIYEEGERKLNEELSIETLLTQVKKMKVLLKNQFILNPEKE